MAGSTPEASSLSAIISPFELTISNLASRGEPNFSADTKASMVSPLFSFI